ncbi:MAG TPA: hypothetical protein VJJ22_02285 [Candidatus Paceibacterota bacterium]
MPLEVAVVGDETDDARTDDCRGSETPEEHIAPIEVALQAEADLDAEVDAEHLHRQPFGFVSLEQLPELRKHRRDVHQTSQPDYGLPVNSLCDLFSVNFPHLQSA